MARALLNTQPTDGSKADGGLTPPGKGKSPNGKTAGKHTNAGSEEARTPAATSPMTRRKPMTDMPPTSKTSPKRRTPLLCAALWALLMLLPEPVAAQSGKWQDIHEVKRKETIFGIARDYGITISELIAANPEMNTPGYTLKKGTTLFIPYPTPKKEEKPAAAEKKTVRIGVMLPLHDKDGDGKRMTEYYRGILMACEQLRKEGISTDIHAWNVEIDDDIRLTLLEDGANKCDIIFGPLYSNQVASLGEFAKAYGIKLVIPFSISGDDVDSNPNIFQVYRSPEDLNEEAIKRFMALFASFHPVFIDCNDRESKKSIFTFGLRKQLENSGIAYSITNLNSSEEVFAKAFSLTQPNIVILNTGRSPELTAAIKKMDGLMAYNIGLNISLFGYTDWLLYEKYDAQKFAEYDTYIPSYFYYNPGTAATQQFERAYKGNFHSPMMEAQPRFAITGYDHAMFFIRGLYAEGKDFSGSEARKDAIQTQLKFTKAAEGSGMRNSNFLLIHYNRDKSISTIAF